MAYLTTQPQIMATAAADVEEIGSAISAARAAAGSRIAALLAPAADEVSAAVTKLFGAYGDAYQAVLKQAAAFHGEFTQALAAAGNAYANAERANAAAICPTAGEAVGGADRRGSDVDLRPYRKPEPKRNVRRQREHALHRLE